MGCSPSRSASSILVEQRNAPILKEVTESDGLKDSDTSDHNDGFLKECMEEMDFQNEEFLQQSMQSTKSELSSKSSSSSWDSGVYELEDDYSHVITENSEPRKVQEVDSEFVPKDDLELILEGKACPTRLSARDRDVLAQQAILEVLREEGLIVRPPSKAVGGIRFELVSAQQSPSNQSSAIRKLPPLSIRRKQKEKKNELTHEEIQQKLIQAEERRKHHFKKFEGLSTPVSNNYPDKDERNPSLKKTEEKLSKMATKDRQEIQTIAEQQAEISRQKLEKKLQATMESREKYLSEVQEKLKAREEYAKKVRQRKQMLANGLKYVLPKDQP